MFLLIVLTTLLPAPSGGVEQAHMLEGIDRTSGGVPTRPGTPRPDAAAEHINRGTDLAGRGQLDAAIAEFRTALRLSPDDALAHCNLGAALASKGDLEGAVAEYRAALKTALDDGPAHLGLGAALARQGKVDAAIDELRIGLRLQPDDEPAHLNLGTALASRGELDAAIEEFRTALRLRRDDALARCNLGAALASKGQPEAAITEYRAALQAAPDDEPAHLGLGAALANTGRVEAAIDEFRAAVRLCPGDVSARLNLGTALASAGRFEAAVGEYRAVLRLRPDDASALVGLGGALQGCGDFAGALDALRRGHASGARQPGWPYPSGRWVQEAERLAALEARLPGVLRGGERPASAEEALDLARICAPKGWYAAAARLYQDAFARRPAWADDLAAAAGYHGACAAACAGTGRSRDVPAPDEAARARWRQQALKWLQDDLTLRAEQLDDGLSPTSGAVRQALLHWRSEPALAGLRDEDEVARLPEPERVACRALWQQIDTLLNASLPAE
jgi:Flp pilus assembly protein TadD